MQTKTLKPCLLFSLGNELFGIDVENVLRVINLEKMLKVPKAPEFILGAISLEGNVIPVVDLGCKIELSKTDISKDTKVIVLEIAHDDITLLVGVAIDDVLDVVTLESSKLLPPALEGLGFDTHVLVGIYPAEEKFYNILNALAIFEKELASIV
jgi:purine-binding chemotaxis protein CheW